MEWCSRCHAWFELNVSQLVSANGQSRQFGCPGPSIGVNSGNCLYHFAAKHADRKNDENVVATCRPREKTEMQAHVKWKFHFRDVLVARARRERVISHRTCESGWYNVSALLHDFWMLISTR